MIVAYDSQIKFLSRGRKSGQHFRGGEEIRAPINFVHPCGSVGCKVIIMSNPTAMQLRLS